MVSVVIAIYNGEKYIEAQLRSVFFQTKKPDEVLIFDDGSTDGTVETVSRFIDENNCGGWQLFKNSENKGYCKNFLEGVKKTKGDIIFLADQDDVWKNEKIAEMTAKMEAQPEITALCCSCDLINGEDEPISDPRDIGVLFSNNDGSIEEFSPNRFVGCSFIRGCSVAFRREILQYIEPIELKGLLSHDWLITFTASLLGRCAVLNKVLMSYRCHGENTSFGERKYGEAALKNRIDALKNSIDGHIFILNNFDKYCISEKLQSSLESQIAFENKRIEFLQSGRLSALFKCAASIFKYKCYYDSVPKGFKVFVGDVLYYFKRKQ